jgi:hypothetical protein
MTGRPWAGSYVRVSREHEDMTSPELQENAVEVVAGLPEPPGWAVVVDRVEAAGGRLEPATEAVDTATSTGRFARRVRLRTAALRRPRFGYRLIDRTYKPLKREAVALADLCRREGQTSLVGKLNTT